jgi:glycine/D-amino acid oxidase-like deaminating enzyme
MTRRDPSKDVLEALAPTKDAVFWLEGLPRVDQEGPLVAHVEADLAIVGGGFLGLWTALLAHEVLPSWEIVLVEQGRVGHAASGRNGGFLESSLTHGLANGLARWPEDMAELESLGLANLEEIAGFLEQEGIDADFERTGALEVATKPGDIVEMEELIAEAVRLGHEAKLLNADELQALVRFNGAVGGLFTRDRCALVHPGKLGYGLAAAARRRGVRIFEGTRIEGLVDQGDAVELSTQHGGSIRAHRVVLATNAFPPLLRGLGLYVLPVWDYVLVTEPLSRAQRQAIGWEGRFGLSDSGNLFHYLRLTRDDRILIGGYDAIYHYGNGVSSRYHQRRETYELLAGHLLAMFPDLEGLRFSHAWGGVIDTSSRFCAFFGSRMRKKVHYAVGFTGLGVGATRFAAKVLTARLLPRSSPYEHLGLVRTKPLPFPPEPMRSGVVALTRASLARADANGGRRNLWLQLLDRMGVGFDS